MAPTTFLLAMWFEVKGSGLANVSTFYIKVVTNVANYADDDYRGAISGACKFAPDSSRAE